MKALWTHRSTSPIIVSLPPGYGPLSFPAEVYASLVLSPFLELMTTSTPAAPEEGAPAPLYMALRVLGLVVLVLMLASMLYASWIALANWGDIGV